MRKFLIAALLASSVPLAGCATLGQTAGTVTLTVDESFLTAQVSFKSLQQVALAGIQSGAFTGATKAKIIDLVDQGQALENTAYATRTSATVTALTGVVSQLTALGVK